MVRFPLAKWAGGVAVRPPLAYVSKLLGEEALALGPNTLVVPVDRLSLFVGEALPAWNAGLKGMSQIHEVLGLDDGQSFGQGRCGRLLGGLLLVVALHRQPCLHQVGLSRFSFGSHSGLLSGGEPEAHARHHD
jgi:hypothetical protein